MSESGGQIIYKQLLERHGRIRIPRSSGTTRRGVLGGRCGRVLEALEGRSHVPRTIRPCRSISTSFTAVSKDRKRRVSSRWMASNASPRFSFCTGIWRGTTDAGELSTRSSRRRSLPLFLQRPPEQQRIFRCLGRLSAGCRPADVAT